jgi:hypothetical protein
MDQPSSSRRVPLGWKIAIVFGLSLFLVLQGKVLLGPGGITSRYTFIQGFTVFNDLMLADPLTTAGLIDLTFLEIVFAVVLANTIPRGRAYWPLLMFFLIAMVIYPGLAGLCFLLFYWRRLGQFRP